MGSFGRNWVFGENSFTKPFALGGQRTVFNVGFLLRTSRVRRKRGLVKLLPFIL
jgi:hypothetical protein